MTALLGGLLSFILSFKYSALFVVLLIAAIGIPLPTVYILLAAAAFSSQGYLNLYVVLAISIVTSLLGDIGVFWLARVVEQKIISHAFFRRLLTPARTAAITAFLERHPILTIVASRFVGVTTVAVNILAGIGQFPFSRYLIWDVLGEVGSNVIYVSIGYLFGSNWIYVAQIFNKVWLAILIVIAVVLLWNNVLKPIHRHRHNKARG